VIIGGGQAGRLADRAVNVSDDAARPADNMMMVITDPSFEPRRAARRLDAADQTRLGQRVQGVIYGLQGDVAHPVTHPGGECVGTEMIAVADRFEQCDPGSGYPQPGAAQLLDGGWRGKLLNTNASIKRMMQV
jgi:hypothetical protein